MSSLVSTSSPPADAAERIRAWARDLGFSDISVAGIDLAQAESELAAWLAAGMHGEMDYMARHGSKRSRPQELVPGTLSVICARMDYLAAEALPAETALANGEIAYVSRYALGRDYHKLIRNRLQTLAERIVSHFGPMGYRVFTDSAPVLEVALAAGSGLGWRGKHSLLLTRDAGSFFFLGEIYTDLPLAPTPSVSDHCGRCTACIEACPTGAIVGEGIVDARRCISYLTIELAGSIPLELRPLIGNRVYGCDDCQLVCPWNRFAQKTAEADFAVRQGLDGERLVKLFSWTEEEFNTRLAGSAIYRIGYPRWLRNLAVGLGNAPTRPDVIQALQGRRDDSSALVREHVEWALERHH